MKTMLNLSLALMLIAGSAGTIDFLRMFQSGEIDKIYAQEEPATAQVTAHQAAAAGPATFIEQVQERLHEIDFEAEDYSRSALIEEEYVRETEPLIEAEQEQIFTEAVAEEPAKPAAKTPTVAPVVTVSNIEPVNQALLQADGELKDKPIATNGAAKPKLKLSMFSRGRIMEEEEVEQVEEVQPTALDSVTQTLFEY
jgi:hypothetical protein